MSIPRDGGPAFPTKRIEELKADPFERTLDYVEGTFPGMSLRDYFAAQALLGIMANDHVDGQGDPERHTPLAYRYADAMLKARD